MASKELTRADLIEEVAKKICYITNDNPMAWIAYRGVAEIILSAILAALQEPTEKMRSAAEEADWEADYDITFADCWRVMLNASALGEKAG